MGEIVSTDRDGKIEDATFDGYNREMQKKETSAVSWGCGVQPERNGRNTGQNGKHRTPRNRFNNANTPGDNSVETKLRTTIRQQK